MTEKNEETTSQIIVKIRKLLNLSASYANLNEALAAAGKAQELMTKYNLSQELIEMESYGKMGYRPSGKKNNLVDSLRDLQKPLAFVNPEDWRSALAQVVCEGSHCRCYETTLTFSKEPPEASSTLQALSAQQVLSVVGFEEDVEFVFSLFHWLLFEIDRLTVSWATGKDLEYKENFRFGAIKKIDLRLKEARKKIEDELKDYGIGSAGKFAIIALDDRIKKIDAFMKKNIDLQESEDKKLDNNLSAFGLGFVKGDGIDISSEKKISENVELKLLEAQPESKVETTP